MIIKLCNWARCAAVVLEWYVYFLLILLSKKFWIVFSFYQNTDAENNQRHKHKKFKENHYENSQKEIVSILLNVQYFIRSYLLIKLWTKKFWYREIAFVWLDKITLTISDKENLFMISFVYYKLLSLLSFCFIFITNQLIQVLPIFR